MVNDQQTQWDATYDVVVLGFGGAGATAARFAADNGATVLLVDAAPEGHEGGNTRYSAQLIGTGENFDGLMSYYKALTAPMHLDESMIETYVRGMMGICDYVKRYLGEEPVSWKHDSLDYKGPVAPIVEEFPEFPGSDSYDTTTITHNFFDGALWRNLKGQVTKRADKIDVLYETPAKQLIQDPESKTVTGVVIARHGKALRVAAKNGVVLATGGFENNQQNIEDYLGASHLSPLGTLYNKGIGLKLGQQVGADMWHMHNYESLGLLHGMAFAVKPGERARLMIGQQLVSQGRVFVIGDDGSRYFNEAEANRHGHLFNHGQWKVPLNQDHPYLIFDKHQKKQLDQDPIIGQYQPYLDNLIKANSIDELAKKLQVSAKVLHQTFKRFNKAAEKGKDPEFHRPAKSMVPFGKGALYAVPLVQTMLNTQGGPRRNTNAEVVDSEGQPIPHLYSAGELGGICANQYQGGGNLAECLIFGKIAGENAAEEKAVPDQADQAVDTTTTASKSTTKLTSDLAVTKKPDYPTEANQYIGENDDGIGGRVVVRVTLSDDHKLANVEVLEQSESEDVGLKAMAELPKQMVAKNTVDVDSVSGASVSSQALKAAVKDALKKVE